VLARAHWGKGYIEAHAIVDGHFSSHPFIIHATADVENLASRRVLEKVGMQCEGILRKYIIHPNISDMPRDSYIYAITK
jgi:RimJ/RimL family protein N-acetyltransferase